MIVSIVPCTLAIDSGTSFRNRHRDSRVQLLKQALRFRRRRGIQFGSEQTFESFIAAVKRSRIAGQVIERKAQPQHHFVCIVALLKQVDDPAGLLGRAE